MNPNVIFIIIASVMFGSAPTVQAFALEDGVSALSLVAICNFTALPAACLILAYEGRLSALRLTRRGRIQMFLVGAALFFTDFLLDVSYRLIPVGYVTMIHFFYPSVVCIALAVSFHERLNIRKISAMILSAAGLFLLAGKGFSGNPLGIVTSLTTAIAYSFYVIGSDKLEVGRLPVSVRVFYANLVAVGLALFIGGLEGLFVPSGQRALGGLVFPSSMRTLLIALGAGGIQLIGFFCMNLGITLVGAGQAAFWNMLEPLTSLMLSALVFRYFVSTNAAIGCALILCAVFFAGWESAGGANRKNKM